MAFVSRKLWKNKPPHSVKLNWGHELAENLIFCLPTTENAGIPREVIYDVDPSRMAADVVFDERGLNFFNTASVGDIEFSSAHPANAYAAGAVPITLFSEFTRKGNNGYNFSTVFSVRGNNAALTFRSASAIGFGVFDGGTSTYTGLYTPVIGNKTSLVGVFSPNARQELYANGVFAASVTPKTTMSATANPIRIGANSATGQTLNGIVGPCLAWAEAFDLGKTQAICENIWQLYMPDTRVLYVDMGAGGLSIPSIAQLSTTADANPALGVVSSPVAQLSGAADANAICGTVLPAMGETATSGDASPQLGMSLPAIAESAASADISATCGTVAAMVATGTVTGDITPPEPEEMPYIPPWRMARVPYSGTRIAAVPATSRVAAVPAASRVAAVPKASRVAAVPAASRVASARIE